MPLFDKTGPQGQGPMTGRGMGTCRGGMGMGRGFGFGRRGLGKRGLGRYFGGNNDQTKEEKIIDAKNYLQALQEEKEDAEKELMDIQKQE